MEEKKKSTVVKTVICILIMAALVIGYYIYIVNKDFRSNSSREKAEEQVTLLLNRDLEKNYPDNPRDLVIYYSDLICCLYNEDLTQEQMSQMAVQLRTLFDVELLEENSLNEYTQRLKEEAAAYKEEKKTISNYQVFKNSEIKYQKMEGESYAILSAYYRLKTNKSSPATTCEEFILRKDAEGYWRILGWELSNGKSLEES